jgi:urocanate hydratase
MGGAQPLAVTMNDGVALCIDVDAWRVRAPRRAPLPRRDRRLVGGRRRPLHSCARREVARCRSGWWATPPVLVPQLLDMDFPADIVTDQTSAHDPLSYVPVDLTPEATAEMARTNPQELIRRSRESMASALPRRWWASWTRAARCSTTATACAPRPSSAASSVHSTTRASSPPTSVRCSARARVRSAGWRCRGDPADIAATDRAVLEEFPDDDGLHRWIQMAGERVAFQGLPARICWLGYGERHRLGLRFNEMVRNGELKAPIVIGRDHLDSGSVASPYRETESMLDGSDAIADWPLLNALVNTSSGATWVSIHHGGGVGIGRSIHAGMVALADGTDLAAEKLSRVLVSDPGMGVIRHADAGYQRAIDVADERGVRVPMREG